MKQISKSKEAKSEDDRGNKTYFASFFDYISISKHF